MARRLAMTLCSAAFVFSGSWTALAENGIASVRTNCGSADHYELKDSTNGKFYFNLKAANHQVIGTSQMYQSKDSRDNGVASVKSNGTTQTVKDET